jgi:hypothetical protein
LGSISTSMETESLKQFLMECRNDGYAGGAKYGAGKINASKTFTKNRGVLSYVDTFLGFTFFAGKEVVLERNNPQWTCVYSGGITQDTIDTNEIYNF